RSPAMRGAAGAAARAALALATAAAALAHEADAAPDVPDSAPFDLLELRVPGRAVQAWSLAPSVSCPSPLARTLLVLSVDGVPPRERRRANGFACLPAANGGSPASEGGAETAERAPIVPSFTLPIPRDVVGVDSADARPDWPGDELLLVAGDGLRVLATDGSGAVQRVAGSGPLPLPARTRAASRMPVAGRCNGRDELSVLLPTAGGVRWLRLRDGARVELALPIESDYRNATAEPPADAPELTTATLAWPALAMADDDGDGRDDLFALWRFGAWVFRTTGDGPTGFAPAPGGVLGPTRRAEFKPFSDEEEIRHAASDVQIFARDLDRDGRADLVVDRTMGGMLKSWASTEVHRNGGAGAETGDAHVARLETQGAIAGVDVLDLDGDARSEIFRTLLAFNARQLLRFVATGRARVDFSVLALDAGAGDGLRETWRDSVSLELDWTTGRIAGVFPDLRGDWNGDGRADLVLPDGARRIAIRLGEDGEHGAAFGGTAAVQPFPLDAASIEAADLDGDALDDLVAFDPRSPDGRVFVLRNRGVLPGTPTAPVLRAAEPDEPR
ncbi:MAG: FG-GAP repeat protein, partial [Myxococcales bacterium]|nr:FG-GAP repeat protein [Myxococcales bacterium]